MQSTWTWAQVITNLKGITARTSGGYSQSTANKYGIDTGSGAWMYIPANAYYTTGAWVNIPWNTIKGKLGAATTGEVLKDKTFSSSNGINIKGTMPNHGTLDWKPSSGTTATVAAGYYSGGTLDSRNAYNQGKTDGSASSVITQSSYKTMNVTVTVHKKDNDHKFLDTCHNDYRKAPYVTASYNCPGQPQLLWGIYKEDNPIVGIVANGQVFTAKSATGWRHWSCFTAPASLTTTSFTLPLYEGTSASEGDTFVITIYYL